MFTLREARRLREKTQNEMARALGISRATYITLELHPGRITIDQAKKICDFLGLKKEEIAFTQS